MTIEENISRCHENLEEKTDFFFFSFFYQTDNPDGNNGKGFLMKLFACTSNRVSVDGKCDGKSESKL